MYVPDNYDQYKIYENRLYNSVWICESCQGGFTDDEMSEDFNYCEDCYNELEQIETEEC